MIGGEYRLFFLCAVGTLLILIINYPESKFRVPFENEKCSRWIKWCNAFLFIPFLVGLLYFYFNVSG